MSMVRQAERPYTAEDLAEMPEDGRRYEVIGGELIVSPSPSERHQRVLVELMYQIRACLIERRLGVIYPAPLDVHLSEHDILQPDLVVVTTNNYARIRERGIWGPPNLVVEIVSPGTSRNDRVRKSATYAAFGVPEYWLVDPEEETILAQELRDGRYQPVTSNDALIRSKVLDGLIVDPGIVFAVPEWMAGSDE